MSAILKLMENMGYTIDQEGMCYGIAHVAVQSALRNKFNQYLKRLEKIGGLLESEEKIFSYSIHADIFAFFDSISIYHASHAFSLMPTCDIAKENFKGFYLGAQDSSAGNRILNVGKKSDLQPDELSRGIHPTCKSLQIFRSKKEIRGYLNAAKGAKKNFSAVFSIINHATAVIFNNGKWHFVNHDEIVSTKGEKLEDVFINAMQNALIGKDETTCCVDITEYGSKKPSKVVYSNSRKVMQEHFKDKRILHLALRTGRFDAVSVYFEEINKQTLKSRSLETLLIAKNRNGTPGLYMALQEGHSKAIKAYLDGISKLSDKSIKLGNLLMAQNSSGTPGLYMALQDGHSNAIKAYFEGISKLDLTPAELITLLQAKDKRGISGLYRVLQEGHSDAIRAYLEGTRKLELKPTELVTLLSAKDDEGTSGLYMALQRGHSAAINAFFEGLSKRKLIPIKLETLLSAKDGEDTPGLYMALQEGHSEAIKAYLEGISKLELKPPLLKTLLKTENSSGTSGLYMALQKGNSGAVVAYFEGISKLNSSDSTLCFAEIKKIYKALDVGSTSWFKRHKIKIDTVTFMDFIKHIITSPKSRSANALNLFIKHRLPKFYTYGLPKSPAKTFALLSDIHAYGLKHSGLFKRTKFSSETLGAKVEESVKNHPDSRTSKISEVLGLLT